jgi:P2-related tail formation protein
VKSFLLSFIIILICSTAVATNYYISPVGNDNNNGTSPTTPWKTIAKINSRTFSAGDVIMFQRGGVWRETLSPLSSGSASGQISFSAYGTGAKPVINGADIYRGNWATTAKPNIWTINSPLANDITPTMMIDGVICSRVNSINSVVNNTFYIDKNATPNKIYIYSDTDPNSRITEISTREYGIYVSRKSFISIANLNVINCLYAGIRLDGHGIFDGNPGTYFNGYCTIAGVSASNSVNYGIVTGNGYSHTTIKNSTAYSNGNGFYADGNGDYTLFQYDTSYNNYRQFDPFTDGNGFGVYKSSFNTIENCVAYDNKSGNGIEIDLNGTDSAIVIRYNVAHGNGSLVEGYGIKTGNLAGLSTSNLVYYNLSYLNGNDPADKMGRELSHHYGNISFYNNTAYTTGTSSAYGITIAGTGRVIFKNNIVFAYGGTNRGCKRRLNTPVLDADNNLYYSTASTPFFNDPTAYSFSGWQGLGYDANSVNANPLFTTNGSNFTLRAGSRAINKGTDAGLTKDILGNPIVGLPDIGAYEFTSANQAPVANAGANRTITLPTSSAALNGSGTDADGTITTYLWQQVSGPSASAFSATNTSGITVSNLQAGTYTYRLTVTDNKNATATDDVTVIVNAAPNQPPMSNAGTNRTITLPTSSATLNGSGTDADGTITTYLWQQVNGPSASTFSATNTANITISNLQAGLYTYRLTVTDNNNAAATDLVTVTVNAAPNQAPVANAGANRAITLPANSTSLSGSASADADGTIASYQWQQVSGPLPSTLSATNKAATNVSNLQAGVYIYRLTVTDNDNATATDEVTVTVYNLPNQAPIANAGTNLVVTLPTNSASLSGSGIDADGTIAGYQWQQISGPATSALSATNTANITVSNLLAGVYTYRLTVTDSDGATDTDDVTVTVSNAPVNQAPNANAGPNRTITLPTSSATLNGSGTDADGTIATYLWQQVSGPSTSLLSATNTAVITVSTLHAGVYTYRLTVTDNDGATDLDLVTVTVNATPNQAPVANAGANKAITLPTNTTSLSGSASADADGTIASYQWQQVSGPSASTLSATNTAGINVSNLQAGVYTYRLTITDNDNATATDEVTVTVNNLPNQAPVANAGANRAITLPANSTSLSGSASADADGTIASYQWQQVSGPLPSTLSATNTAAINVSNLQAGEYRYRLTVTDNDNATATDEVTVTVYNLPNQAPVANAGTNLVITLPTNSASLSGSGIDADGTITGYEWQQISGPATSALSAANTANIAVSNLQAGVYIYRLTVRDDDNATGTDNITVTVNAVANAAPIADAGTDQTIAVTANSTTLNAEQSTDPDGTITNYLWQQVSGPGTSVFSSTSGMTVDVSNLLAGEYIYRLTVTDNKNATATATVKVSVIDNFINYTIPVVVYPNPATDVINIRLLNTIPGRVQINVYDITGKTVLPATVVNKPAGAYSLPVTVSGLTPGSYVIRVSTFGRKKMAATFLKL